MRTAVHRTVGGQQELPLGVEHLQRLLRRGTGIQVRQLMSAAHNAVQDREVRADARDIESGAEAVISGPAAAAWVKRT